MVRVIEQERGGESVFIERHGLETEGEGGGAAEGDPIATKLNMRQLAELLAERERLMRQGGEAGQPTDQWRAFLINVSTQGKKQTGASTARLWKPFNHKGGSE